MPFPDERLDPMGVDPLDTGSGDQPDPTDPPKKKKDPFLASFGIDAVVPTERPIDEKLAAASAPEPPPPQEKPKNPDPYLAEFGIDVELPGERPQPQGTIQPPRISADDIRVAAKEEFASEDPWEKPKEEGNWFTRMLQQFPSSYHMLKQGSANERALAMGDVIRQDAVSEREQMDAMRTLAFKLGDSDPGETIAFPSLIGESFDLNPIPFAERLRAAYYDVPWMKYLPDGVGGIQLRSAVANAMATLSGVIPKQRILPSGVPATREDQRTARREQEKSFRDFEEHMQWLQEHPMSKNTQAFIENFLDDPAGQADNAWGAITEMGAQSAVFTAIPMIMGAGAGALTGSPLGAAAGGFAGGYMVEYTTAFGDGFEKAARERFGDRDKPYYGDVEFMRKVYNGEIKDADNLIAEASQYGHMKALGTAGFDAVSSGAIASIATKQAMGFRGALKTVGEAALIEPITESAGEATGQMLAGITPERNEVFAEAVGSLMFGGGHATVGFATNAQATVQARRDNRLTTIVTDRINASEANRAAAFGDEDALPVPAYGPMTTEEKDALSKLARGSSTKALLSAYNAAADTGYNPEETGVLQNEVMRRGNQLLERVQENVDRRAKKRERKRRRTTNLLAAVSKISSRAQRFYNPSKRVLHESVVDADMLAQIRGELEEDGVAEESLELGIVRADGTTVQLSGVSDFEAVVNGTLNLDDLVVADETPTAEEAPADTVVPEPAAVVDVAEEETAAPEAAAPEVAAPEVEKPKTRREREEEIEEAQKKADYGWGGPRTNDGMGGTEILQMVLDLYDGNIEEAAQHLALDVDDRIGSFSTKDRLDLASESVGEDLLDYKGEVETILDSKGWKRSEPNEKRDGRWTYEQGTQYDRQFTVKNERGDERTVHVRIKGLLWSNDSQDKIWSVHFGSTQPDGTVLWTKLDRSPNTFTEARQRAKERADEIIDDHIWGAINSWIDNEYQNFKSELGIVARKRKKAAAQPVAQEEEAAPAEEAPAEEAPVEPVAEEVSAEEPASVEEAPAEAALAEAAPAAPVARIPNAVVERTGTLRSMNIPRGLADAFMFWRTMDTSEEAAKLKAENDAAAKDLRERQKEENRKAKEAGRKPRKLQRSKKDKERTTQISLLTRATNKARSEFDRILSEAGITSDTQRQDMIDAIIRSELDKIEDPVARTLERMKYNEQGYTQEGHKFGLAPIMLDEVGGDMQLAEEALVRLAEEQANFQVSKGESPEQAKKDAARFVRTVRSHWDAIQSVESGEAETAQMAAEMGRRAMAALEWYDKRGLGTSSSVKILKNMVADIAQNGPRSAARIAAFEMAIQAAEEDVASRSETSTHTVEDIPEEAKVMAARFVEEGLLEESNMVVSSFVMALDRAGGNLTQEMIDSRIRAQEAILRSKKIARADADTREQYDPEDHMLRHTQDGLVSPAALIDKVLTAVQTEDATAADVRAVGLDIVAAIADLSDGKWKVFGRYGVQFAPNGPRSNIDMEADRPVWDLTAGTNMPELVSMTQAVRQAVRVRKLQEQLQALPTNDPKKKAATSKEKEIRTKLKEAQNDLIKKIQQLNKNIDAAEALLRAAEDHMGMEPLPVERTMPFSRKRRSAKDQEVPVAPKGVQSIGTKRVMEIVERVKKKLGHDKVHVVVLPNMQSLQEVNKGAYKRVMDSLPEGESVDEIQFGGMMDTRGPRRTVYLFSDNIGSEVDAIKLYFHEALQHRGMRQFLGHKEWQNTMRKVYRSLTSLDAPADMRMAVAEIAAEYGAEYDADGNMTDASQIKVADEFLSLWAESMATAPESPLNKSLNGRARRMANHIAAAYNRMVGDNTKLTHSEVVSALIGASKSLRNPEMIQQVSDETEVRLMKSVAMSMMSTTVDDEEAPAMARLGRNGTVKKISHDEMATTIPMEERVSPQLLERMRKGQRLFHSSGVRHSTLPTIDVRNDERTTVMSQSDLDGILEEVIADMSNGDKELADAIRADFEEFGFKSPDIERMKRAIRLADRSRYWFELSAEGIYSAMRENFSERQIRDMFRLIGATSARANPEQNLKRALAIMAQNIMNVPVATDVLDIATPLAALYDERFDSHKIENFANTFLFLLGMGDAPLSTNDVWVARTFRMNDERGEGGLNLANNDQVYEAASRYFNKLRDRFNSEFSNEQDFEAWESWQVQAIMWAQGRIDEGLANNVAENPALPEHEQDANDYHQELRRIGYQLNQLGIEFDPFNMRPEDLTDPRVMLYLSRTLEHFAVSPTIMAQVMSADNAMHQAATNMYDAARGILRESHVRLFNGDAKERAAINQANRFVEQYEAIVRRGLADMTSKNTGVISAVFRAVTDRAFDPSRIATSLESRGSKLEQAARITTTDASRSKPFLTKNEMLAAMSLIGRATGSASMTARAVLPLAYNLNWANLSDEAKARIESMEAGAAVALLPVGRNEFPSANRVQEFAEALGVVLHNEVAVEAYAVANGFAIEIVPESGRPMNMTLVRHATEAFFGENSTAVEASYTEENIPSSEYGRHIQNLIDSKIEAGINDIQKALGKAATDESRRAAEAYLNGDTEDAVGVFGPADGEVPFRVERAARRAYQRVERVSKGIDAAGNDLIALQGRMTSRLGSLLAANSAERSPEFAEVLESVGIRLPEGTNPRILTEQFQQRFGDSVVTDEFGFPKPVYHGTRAAFYVHKPSMSGRSSMGAGPGMYYAEDPRIADTYAESDPEGGVRGNTMKGYLRISNPLDFESEVDMDELSDFMEMAAEKLVVGRINQLDRAERDKNGVGLGMEERAAARDEMMDEVTDDMRMALKQELGWKPGDMLLWGDVLRALVNKRWLVDAAWIPQLFSDMGYDGIRHIAYDKAGSSLMSGDYYQKNSFDYGPVWVAWRPSQVLNAIGDPGFWSHETVGVRDEITYVGDNGAVASEGVRFAIFGGKKGSTQNPAASAQFSEAVERALGVAVIRARRGKMHGKAARTERETGAILTRNTRDVTSIMREVGKVVYHKMMYGRLIDLPKSQRDAVRQSLIDQFWGGQPKSASNKRKDIEAMANFMLEWAEDSNAVKAKAPEWSRFFEDTIDELGLTAEFNNMRGLFMNVKNMSPMERVDELVLSSVEHSPGRLSVFAQRLFSDPRGVAASWLDNKITNWIDEYYPLYKFQHNILGGRAPESIDDDAYALFRLAKGSQGVAKGFIENGVQLRTGINPLTGKAGRSKSLEDILTPVISHINDFEQYAVARRAQEMWQKRPEIDIPLTKDEADAVVAEYEGRDTADAFKVAFSEIQDFNKAVLSYAVDEGLLSEENMAAIQALNESYIPWHRVVADPANPNRSIRAGTRNTFKKIKGNEDLQIDKPLETLIHQTYHIVDAVERNRAMQALSRLVPRDTKDTFYNDSPFLQKHLRPSSIEIKVNGVVDKEMVFDLLKKQGVDQDVLDDLDADYDLTNLMLRFVEPLYGLTANKQWQQVVVMEKGVPRFLEVDPVLFDIISGSSSWSRWLNTSFMGSILTRPASWLRAGATGMNPAFTLPNIVRDTLARVAQSERGVTTATMFETLDPIILTAEYMAGWLPGDSEVRQRFDAAMADFVGSGGYNATITSLDRNYLKAQMDRLALKQLKQETGGGIGGLLRTPGELLMAMGSGNRVRGARNVANRVLHKAERLNDFAENLNRLAEFRKVYAEVFEVQRSKGKTEEEARREAVQRAALASRNVTIDFSRMGRYYHFINQVVPFSNATMQGFVRTFEAIAQNPARATLVGMHIAAVSLGTFLLRMGNPHYDELPEYVKDMYWNIPNPFGPEDKDGWQKTFFRIPKPHLWGIMFGSAVERSISAIHQKDPSIMLDWARTAGEQMPVNVTALIESLDPDLRKKGSNSRLKLLEAFDQIIGIQALMPFAELTFNYDMFRERPIVPYFMEGTIDPAYMYSSGDTPTSILLSKYLPGQLSAAQWDHVINGYTAGLGRILVGSADPYARKILENDGVTFAGEVDRSSKLSTKTDVPIEYVPFFTSAAEAVMRAFVAEEPGYAAASLVEFGQIKSVIDRKKKTWDEIKEKEPENADAYYQENKDAIDLKSGGIMDKMEGHLGDLRKQLKKVIEAPPEKYTPEQKRVEMDRIYERMIFYAQRGLQEADETYGANFDRKKLPEWMVEKYGNN